MHGSRLLCVDGENKRLNGKQKYNPKEGFVKSRNGESANQRIGEGSVWTPNPDEALYFLGVGAGGAVARRVNTSTRMRLPVSSIRPSGWRIRRASLPTGAEAERAGAGGAWPVGEERQRRGGPLHRPQLDAWPLDKMPCHELMHDIGNEHLVRYTSLSRFPTNCLEVFSGQNNTNQSLCFKRGNCV